MAELLDVGTKVPDLTGKDQNGNNVSLKNLLGSKVALYFYPKDDTPGCTTQACNLRDNEAALKAQGIVVIGVSVDTETKHQKFIEKFALNFPLIADTDHTWVEAFGVWAEKSMYGKKYMGTNRVTYLIDETGTITQRIEKVKVAEHSQQILTGFT